MPATALSRIDTRPLQQAARYKTIAPVQADSCGNLQKYRYFWVVFDQKTSYMNDKDLPKPSAGR
jgi:hypothetical protein